MLWHLAAASLFGFFAMILIMTIFDKMINEEKGKPTMIVIWIICSTILFFVFLNRF